MKKAAKSLLDLLEVQNIKSTRDLIKLLGKDVLIDKKTNESIYISGSVEEYTLYYILPGTGKIIDINLNEKLNYFKITTKGFFKLSEYNSFARDDCGNLIQDKKVLPSIPSLKEELRNLVEYKP